MYNVFHEYDVDGGFGDAVRRKDLIATFENKDLADKFVNAFENAHIYSEPYSKLKCGKLSIEEVKIYSESDFNTIIANFRPWWKQSADGGINTDFDILSMSKRLKEMEENIKKESYIESIYKCDDNSRIAYWDSTN